MSRKVLLRDLVLFQIKLGLDGLKGIVLFQGSIAAAIVDLILMRWTRGRLFYGVLRLAEKADLWLNLYGAAEGAGDDRDGLFGRSRAGDHNFLGRLEELVREKERELGARRRVA